MSAIRRLALSVCIASGGAALAQQPAAKDPPAAAATKPAAAGDFFRLPMPPKRDLPPNTMLEPITRAAKKNAIQSMMLANPLSLRDMINLMVDKRRAKDGLSFDDVVESMKLRANSRNFKLVGHSPFWKDVVAITGDKSTPRVEIFSFCDAVAGRMILDYSPEFVAFLPCRIAVLEDAKKKIWLVTLDWDVTWLDTSQHPDTISPQLRQKSIEIRDAMADIMDAAAEGDF